jgi:hypothetical protein
MTHLFSTISIRMKLFSKQVLQMVKSWDMEKTLIKGFFFGDFDAMFNKLHGKNYHTKLTWCRRSCNFD